MKLWTALLKVDPWTANGAQVSLFADARLEAGGGLGEAGRGWSSQAVGPENSACASLRDADLSELSAQVGVWDKNGCDRAKLGARLFDMLVATPAGAQWAALRDAVDRTEGGGLRTLFEIAPPGTPPVAPIRDLRVWPWELLRDGRNPDRRIDYVFADLKHPACRLVRQGDAVDPVPWPFRVLVIVGPAEETKNIEWRSERRALLRQFASRRHDVEARFLNRPDIATVKEAIQSWKPNAFHFIGHAGSTGDGTSWLELGTASKKTQWTADQITHDLEDANVLCAVINACKTGAGAVPASIANAFVQARARVVIAMGSDISGASASTFGQSFYERLFAGDPVDLATRTARRALQAWGIDRHDWVIPRLLVCHRDVETKSIDDVLRLSLREEPPMKGVQPPAFVDRHLERSIMVTHVVECPGPRAMWLRGQAKVGKSALARWCAQRAKFHGAALCFVDFAKDRRELEPALTTWLGTLRQIRDKSTRDPNRLFSAFASTCNHVLDGRDPPSLPPIVPVQDVGLEYRPSVRTPENWNRTVWESYQTGLNAAAKELGRLLVVLDHFDDCDASIRGPLLGQLHEQPSVYVPGLLSSVLRRDLVGVDVLVVTRSPLRELQDFGTTLLPQSDVPLFPPVVQEDVVKKELVERESVETLLDDFIDLQPVPKRYEGHSEIFYKYAYEMREAFKTRLDQPWNAGWLDLLGNLLQGCDSV